MDAWRNAELPFYVTNNMTMANSAAEIVLAFWRDQQRLNPADEPLVICELGGGSGRFAYHFLKRLLHWCEQDGIPPESFRYVLTDLPERTLDFWRAHPRFRPFFESGLLDIARFDMSQSDSLALRVSGETLGAGSLARPPGAKVRISGWFWLSSMAAS